MLVLKLVHGPGNAGEIVITANGVEIYIKFDASKAGSTYGSKLLGLLNLMVMLVVVLRKEL